MRLDLDAMIDAARAASAGERIPLQVVYDEAKLRKALATLNEQASTPAQFSIITGTTAMSRSFVMEGGLVIDIESALQQIDDRLRSVGAGRSRCRTQSRYCVCRRQHDQNADHAQRLYQSP
jgi:hypothetical protein